MSVIDWREWAPKTLKQARKRQKPIILFLTASWSSLCREMEDTTLSDPAVTDMIGELFVPVRVDTDRRPDIFRRFTMGGWPSIVFLDPAGDFITGTTFAAPAKMITLLSEVSPPDKETVTNGTSAVRTRAVETAPLKPPLPAGTPAYLSGESIDYFFSLARDHYDRRYGGFGDGPKFPMAPACRLLMARAFQGDRVAGEMLDQTLRSMSEGAIHDTDGGFRRCASRRDWSDPQPELLLADQAELALLYLDAFSLTKEATFGRTAEQILDFIEATFAQEEGGFAGSLLLTKAGTLDKTVFAGPIARTCSAFIKADAVLNREDAGALAVDTIDFLFNRLINDDNLFRHYIDTAGPELLADQTDVLTMLLDAFESSGNPAFIDEAARLAYATKKLLFDKAGGAWLDARPSDFPNAMSLTPHRSITENARIAIALFRLSGITGDDDHRIAAESCLNAFGSSYRLFGLLAADYGLAVAWLLEPTLEIFLWAKNRKALKSGSLWHCARSNFHPRKIILIKGGRKIKTPPTRIAKTSQPIALVGFGPDDPVPTDNDDDLIRQINQAV